MNETLGRRLVFCFCGGLIGTFLALQWSHLWWLVAALAAGIGWIVADINGFMTAVRQAWRAVIGWLPGTKAWIDSALCGLYLAVMVFLDLLYLTPVLMTISWLTELTGKERLRPLSSLLSSLLEGYLIPSFAFGVLGFLLTLYIGKDREGIVEALRKGVSYLLPTFAIPKIFRGGWWCVKKVPTATALFAKFAVKAIQLAHSDKRTLYAVAFAVGTVAGYFAGQPLVGGIVSVGIGWLDWNLLSLRLGWRQA